MTSESSPRRSLAETFGERIERLRRRKELSQEGLAILCGVSRRTVFGWEKDDHRPRRKHLALLSRALDVPVRYLEVGDAGIVDELTRLLGLGNE